MERGAAPRRILEQEVTEGNGGKNLVRFWGRISIKRDIWCASSLWTFVSSMTDHEEKDTDANSMSKVKIRPLF